MVTSNENESSRRLSEKKGTSSTTGDNTLFGGILGMCKCTEVTRSCSDLSRSDVTASFRYYGKPGDASLLHPSMIMIITIRKFSSYIKKRRNNLNSM